LWGRAEPRGPELLRGGRLRIIFADQVSERRDERAVRVQESPPPRKARREGHPQSRPLFHHACVFRPEFRHKPGRRVAFQHHDPQ
jgi:hypothetical protein